MPVIYGNVAAPSTTSAADGTNLPLLQGKQGEGIVAEIHGRHYTQNYRGNLFFASTAATGVTISIFSNASYTGLALWNPQGSGKNLSVIRTLWAQTTVATTAAGQGYAWLNNAGASLGTAAPISALSTTGVIRGTGQCSVPGIGASVVQNAVISATLTTAMTWGRFSGGAIGTGATTVQASLGVVADVFDGDMIIPPGTFWAMTSSAASASTAWGLSAVWEELPL
jgi:hypothetical protein